MVKTAAQRKGAESCNGRDARTERRKPVWPGLHHGRRAKELKLIHGDTLWEELSVFDLEMIS